jgi:flagellar biosynthesis chaperone FliJ
MQGLHDTYSAQVQEREKIISNLTESLSKAELELTLQMEDFKKEIENLRETLQSAEDERDKYAALCDKQHAEHSK